MPRDSDAPRPISVWHPRRVDGELVFERPAPLPLGDHYAARRRIRARTASGTKRICFFGESVAAGYLYAPHLTPATVLERLLAPAAAGACEVIDLARTNETLSPLAATVASSLQLAPDALVIFAGNNWTLLETPEVSPYFPSVRARQRYALALRRGLARPIVDARRRLHRRVEDTLAEIAAVAAGVPVVVVVPEVNLGDWESRQPVPWLPGDRTARWHARYADAVAALAAAAWSEAEEAACDLAALDQGLCPTAHLIRGRALAGRGDLAAARDAFETAVEHGSYAALGFLDAPRIDRRLQELLRAASARHGFACVDLPAVFAAHTGSPLPGRRLFLDYCHLTREGIQVAMAAVAAAVRGALHGPSAEVEEPAAADPTAVDPAVDPAVEAVARIGAAVHGNHRLVALGPKGPWLEPWLREAVAAWPGAVAALRDLAEARCAPCPAVLTAAQQRNLASPAPFLLQHGWRWEHLDVEVLTAIARVLADVGEPLQDDLERWLLAHHGVEVRPRDLSRPPFLWEPLERLYPEVVDEHDLGRRATFRAAWPETSFCLVCDARSRVRLELVMRLPAVPGWDGVRQGDVAVAVNGHRLEEVPAGERWSRAAVSVPVDVLVRGINRVTLRWPALPAAGAAALEDAVRRLERGIEADLHPLFGELFSLMARTHG